jgi:chorismate mutase
MASSLEDLRNRLQQTDEALLRALSARAAFPQNPAPAWEGIDPRLPAPPLAEILYAMAPAGTAEETDAFQTAQSDLMDGLLARQQLGVEIAEAKVAQHPEDYLAAIGVANREVVLQLLTDLPTEVMRLNWIQKTAQELAPGLSPDDAVLLWREHLIPWTRQVEVDHLLVP